MTYMPTLHQLLSAAIFYDVVYWSSFNCVICQ